MEDREIIELYNARSESAIARTDEKYGSYCRSIAFNILQNDEDTEECINDTYLRVWNTIPPQVPACFRAFIGRIARNLSFDVFRRDHAEKRYGDRLPLVLDELSECIPAKDTTEELADESALINAINRFLADLPPHEQWIFSRRYWNTDSVKDIANALGSEENTVKVTLYRTRKKLLCALEKEGFYYASRGSV